MGLLQVDDRVFRKSQVAQIRSDGHVANHGTAHEHHLATVLVGGVDNLLHTVHMLEKLATMILRVAWANA